MILYSTGKDASKEKWDGASTNFEDVVGLFGADEARPLENFVDDLRAFSARAERVYADVPQAHHRHQNRRNLAKGLLRYLAHSTRSARSADHPETYYLESIGPSSKRSPLAPLVGALRSVKSRFEVDLMKMSADISAKAHAKVSGPPLVTHAVVYILIYFFHFVLRKDDALGSAWTLRSRPPRPL
jgi:intermediate cleaving peptidase 55